MNNDDTRFASGIKSLLDGYVERRQIPGYGYAIDLHGSRLATGFGGASSLETGAPLRADSVFRIFSMSKPITSVAAMMLVENGSLELDGPITRYVPELQSVRVYQNVGLHGTLATVPLVRPITLRHLLTHTAGFTYHFMADRFNIEGPVQQLYRRHGIKPSAVRVAPLAEDPSPQQAENGFIAALAAVPLVHQPGVAFEYSVAVDVIGIVLSRVTGRALDEFLEEALFAPLGMVDTAFHVPPCKLHRFTSSYRTSPTGLQLVDAVNHSDYRDKPTFFSAGGGLVSTVEDYLRFARMLLGQGEFGGRRYLSPATVAEMSLPQVTDDALGASTMDVSKGTGFGLGLGIFRDEELAQTPVAPGSLFWGGAASTHFWIDPKHELAAVVMTQVLDNDADRLDRAVHRQIYEHGVLKADIEFAREC